MMEVFRTIFIFPVKVYQWIISPLFPSSCRHVPTCSQYMEQAIKEWGIPKGLLLGIKRIGRCHPFGTSGYDPVPLRSAGVAVVDCSPMAEELEETSVLLPQFEKRGGVLPVIVQESESGQVLMLGYANREALTYSVEHRTAAFWSTSRGELWIKGQTSGNTLRLNRVLVDCDQDALVYQVTLAGGGVCHTLNRKGTHRKASFYRKIDFNTNKLDFMEP